MNCVIFSQCNLITFSFKVLLSEILKLSSPSVDSDIKVHNSINIMIKEMDANPWLILLDINGMYHQDVHSILLKIKCFENATVILYCENYADLCNLPVIYDAFLYRDSKLNDIKKTLKICCNTIDSTNKMKCVETILAKSQLTKRESETLKFIISGLNNNQIAKKLFISHKTVSAYRRSICRKFDIENLNLYYLKYRETQR
ncbi:LuxR C-terminal-related transcriptional regulator [Yersinia sp. 2545 StPb PI]|uniref:helix-turn-helix transcriptional regulator n=1 Tax=Yersinia sp. 2545 StPb PI TaxID=3117410 RepID=UPI003FA469BF